VRFALTVANALGAPDAAAAAQAMLVPLGGKLSCVRSGCEMCVARAPCQHTDHPYVLSSLLCLTDSLT
jgi:hypothetical protein